MSQNLPDENLLRNYLLAQLAENEQDMVEERLLTDPEFFETSLIIEGELLDDYVMGSLSEYDRMKLESGLLTNVQQQRRVQLIRLLRLRSNATCADERLTLFSRLNQHLSLHRNNLAFAYVA